MSNPPLSALFVVLALVVGMWSSPAAAQVDDGSSPDGQTPANHAAGMDEPELLDMAHEIAARLAHIRGLSLENKIHKGIRNRDQLRRTLIENLAEEATDAEVRHEAEVFKKLGLIPQDLNYKQTLLDLLTEQIAGFYDPDAEELYIMQGIPRTLQRPAMSHEIFHAIQDQHFDIQRMVEPIDSQNNADFSVARSSLLEGDAMMIMIDFMAYEAGILPMGSARSMADVPTVAKGLGNLGDQSMGALASMMPQDGQTEGAINPAQLSNSALASAPRMMQKLLTFPYFGGMHFIINARAGHDWERVDQIYDHPPVSTEQILHPKRYFAGDDPEALAFEVTPVVDAGDLIYETVFGEYQMRLLLEQHLLADHDSSQTHQQINQAVQGWDGDRLKAYELDDDHLVVSHLSVWDTLSDAREYFDALTDMMKTRFPDAVLSHNRGKYGQSLCLWVDGATGAERVYLEQWGDLVLHLEGLPTELDSRGHETDPTAYLMRQRIMNSVERTPFAKVYHEKLEAYDAKHRPQSKK